MTKKKTLKKEEIKAEHQLEQTVQNLRQEMKKMTMAKQKKRVSPPGPLNARLAIEKNLEGSIKRAASEYTNMSVIPYTHPQTADPQSDLDHMRAVFAARKLDPETLKANAYLRSLVDPEGDGRDSGVPDEYTEPTYRYQSITEINVTNARFSKDGYTVIHSCPDITSHLFLSGGIDKGERYSFICAEPYMRGQLIDRNICDPADGLLYNTEIRRVILPADHDTMYSEDIAPIVQGGGVIPVLEHAYHFKLNPAKQVTLPINYSQLTGIGMWPGSAEVDTGAKWLFPTNVKGNTDTLRAYPVPMSRGVDGVLRMGASLDLSAQIRNVVQGTNQTIASFYVILGGMDAVGQEVQFGYVYNAMNGGAPLGLTEGNILDTPLDAVGGAAGLLIWSDTPAAALAPTLNGTNAIWMFDRVILAACGILNTNNVSLDYDLKRLQFGITYNGQIQCGEAIDDGQPGHPAPGFVVEPVSCAELGLFNDGITTGIRMVSMSTWITYLGGTLYDSGVIYGNYIHDRRPPTDRDHTYSNVAGLVSIGNTFRGKLPSGGYAIWKPMRHQDLAFRAFDTVWNWSRPFTTFIAQQQTVAGQNMTVRLVANWEIITINPAFRGGLKVSTIAPEQIINVFRVLGGFPMVMENDNHVEKMISFFKNVAGVTKQVGSAIKPVYGALRPILGSTLGRTPMGMTALSVGDFLSNLF